MKPDFKITKSGVRTLLVDNNTSPSVAIVVLAGVGSRYETDAEAGIAHFVEHTLFKGSKKYPTSKIIDMEIELLGGTSNAFTSYDYTGYYIKIPKDNFEKSFEILADMINSPLFTESEIEKEKGVICEEIKMYNDLPRSRVSEIFTENLYARHPLGRNIAGTQETVKATSREQLRLFAEKYYTKANLLISIAGNFDKKLAEELCEIHFGSLPQGQTIEPQHFSNHRISKNLVVENKDLEQAHIVMGGYAPRRNSKNKYALQIGNSILSYGFGSKLFQKIRDELGLAYYIGASISSYADTGRYSIALGTDKKNAKKAIEAILTELESLIKGDFSDKDFERARNYLLGSMTTDLEAAEDIAVWFGLQKLLKDELLSVDEYINRLNSENRNSVIDAWREMLEGKEMLIATLAPENTDFSNLTANINF